MLIGGLWHGADWKFVFWGAMHGVGLAIHKAFKPLLSRIPDNWMVKAISWSMTMIVVSLLWVFFRAESWQDSIIIIKNIFVNFRPDYIPVFASVRYVWLSMMAIIIISHALPRHWYGSMSRWFVRSPWIVKFVIFVVVVQLVVQFMSEEVSPFIYFQF